jgi:hypothetical protein
MAVAAASKSSASLFGPRAGFETVLAGASGRALRVEGQWRPVIGLGEGRLRGHLLHVDVRESHGALGETAVDRSALNPVDAERIDLAAAEQGLAALTPFEATDTPPLVFLPTAWTTARAPRARRRLLQITGQAQARLRMLPVAEMLGLDAGVPPSQVREAAGLLQPIFRGVLARAALKRGRQADLTDCGLTGAAVEAGDLGECRDAPAMLRTVLTLQRIGPGVMLHSLRSVAALHAARVAGARWASLDIVQAGWRLARDAEAALGED